MNQRQLKSLAYVLVVVPYLLYLYIKYYKPGKNMPQQDRCALEMMLLMGTRYLLFEMLPNAYRLFRAHAHTFFRHLAIVMIYPYVLLVRILLLFTIDLPNYVSSLIRKAKHRRARSAGVTLALPKKLRHIDLLNEKQVDAYWKLNAPKFPQLEVRERPRDKETFPVLVKRYKSYVLAQDLTLGNAQREVMVDCQRRKSC